jgi:hypothetical protein
MANDNPLLRQMKVSVDYGQIMPNIPQMGVTLAPWEQLFRSRQTVKLLRKQPCKKPRRTCVIRKAMKIELLFFGIGKHLTDSLDRVCQCGARTSLGQNDSSEAPGTSGTVWAGIANSVPLGWRR